MKSRFKTKARTFLYPIDTEFCCKKVIVWSMAFASSKDDIRRKAGVCQKCRKPFFITGEENAAP
jgi:hypothetical protein